MERGGFAHFMLKEIFEQPQTVTSTLAGRLTARRGDGEARPARISPTTSLLAIDNIVITACGTSWHSGLIGEHMLEELGADPGRGRVRVGVPIPQPDRQRSHAVHRDLAVG